MNKLLTPRELSKLLDIKVSTIYQWTHIEYIPFIKVGRFVRFNEDTISRWLREKEQNGRVTRKVGFKYH